VKLAFAWQSLVHNKARAAVSVGGVSFSILLVFVQLGTYDALDRTATLIQDSLTFDLVLVSPDYVFVARPGTFPRRRLEQARAVPGVESAAPFYVGIKSWRNVQTGGHWRVFMMAFRTEDRVFGNPEIVSQLPALRRPDTVLMDRHTHPEYGAQATGLVTELGRRNVEVVGQYTVGTGFLANGAVVMSDQNFARLSDDYPLEHVNLGLVTLRPGADPEDVARRLRTALPPDVLVRSRAEQAAHEKLYWAAHTSVGLICGFGTAVAVVVGLVILYQVLATDLANHLPEYATLKALGYRDGDLAGLVMLKVVLLGLMAYAPAVPLALLIYAVTRESAKLPIFMTGPRLLVVLAITLAMGALSARLALRKLRTADPADLY
jgi:putative ABC transport system permease protein